MDDLTARQIYQAGLSSLSTVDGREVLYTYGLRKFLSEGALHRYRAIIMIELLIAFSESTLTRRPNLSEEQKQFLRFIYSEKQFDAMVVAEYDHFGRKGHGPLEHDVKAVEYYLQEELSGYKDLNHLCEWLHFPMTSEDNNNLAWNLMLRNAINQEWLPALLEVLDEGIWAMVNPPAPGQSLMRFNG